MRPALPPSISPARASTCPDGALRVGLLSTTGRRVTFAAQAVGRLLPELDFGIQVAEPTVDFAAVMARRDKVVSTLTSGVSGLFKKNKIELVAAAATLTGDGTVRAGDDELA